MSVCFQGSRQLGGAVRCGAVCLPSAANAHRPISRSVPTDSRQFARIPAAPARHLLLKQLLSPPASGPCSEHPPGSPPPAPTAPGRPVRPLLTPGAIASGQVAEVSLVNNASDQSWRVNGKHSGPAVSSCVQGCCRDEAAFRGNGGMRPSAALRSVHPSSACGAGRRAHFPRGLTSKPPPPDPLQGDDTRSGSTRGHLVKQFRRAAAGGWTFFRRSTPLV